MTHAASFVLGFTAVFTFIGASVGLIGAVVSQDSSYAVRDNLPLLARIGGVFLVIMGLNLIGVIRIPWLYRTYTLETTSAGGGRLAAGAAGGGTIVMGGRGSSWHGLTYAKSFGVGSAFAVGWTPCIGPVLGAILTLSASSSSVAKGGYLPEKVGMRPMQWPYRPTVFELHRNGRLFPPNYLHESWLDYLYWDTELEP